MRRRKAQPASEPTVLAQALMDLGQATDGLAPAVARALDRGQRLNALVDRARPNPVLVSKLLRSFGNAMQGVTWRINRLNAATQTASSAALGAVVDVLAPRPPDQDDLDDDDDEAVDDAVAQGLAEEDS